MAALQHQQLQLSDMDMLTVRGYKRVHALESLLVPWRLPLLVKKEVNSPWLSHNLGA